MTDLPGKAIFDFYFQRSKSKLYVHDTFGPKSIMEVETYFRPYREMPQLEKLALENCTGKTLDVGAGAGSHVLELQKRGFDISALEISPASCEVMRERSVKKIFCEDFFDFNKEKFDTILLLMNGIGLCGSLDGLRVFLQKAKNLLNPGGRLVFDSCDVSYIYDGLPRPQHYFGEIKCRYEYAGNFTDWFYWLYMDQKILTQIAREEGWNVEILFEDQFDQYLSVLTLI